MTFTFKRDREGNETVHCGGTRVAVLHGGKVRRWQYDMLAAVDGVNHEIMEVAIERADAADFWAFAVADGPIVYLNNEVTVEVPT